MCVRTDVCVNVLMYMYTCIHKTHTCVNNTNIKGTSNLYSMKHASLCARIYIFIYIHIHTHTHTQTHIFVTHAFIQNRTQVLLILDGEVLAGELPIDEGLVKLPLLPLRDVRDRMELREERGVPATQSAKYVRIRELS
jgi:hypothetical protein